MNDVSLAYVAEIVKSECEMNGTRATFYLAETITIMSNNTCLSCLLQRRLIQDEQQKKKSIKIKLILFLCGLLRYKLIQRRSRDILTAIKLNTAIILKTSAIIAINSTR